MEESAWRLVWFTTATAFFSTLLILPAGTLCAWLLARHSWRGKALVETCISLPLVLPPVATGLVLLKLLGRHGIMGAFLAKHLGIEIVFTWRAVVLAMAVMSFPLLVRSLRTALEGVNPRLEQVAQTLGASKWRVFWTVSLPLAWRGLLAGMLLAFARALGEFGATIMVAGNIPGETQTLALAIFHRVQIGQDERAYILVVLSALLAFGAVLTSEILSRRRAP